MRFGHKSNQAKNELPIRKAREYSNVHPCWLSIKLAGDVCIVIAVEFLGVIGDDVDGFGL